MKQLQTSALQHPCPLLKGQPLHGSGLAMLSEPTRSQADIDGMRQSLNQATQMVPMQQTNSADPAVDDLVKNREKWRGGVGNTSGVKSSESTGGFPCSECHQIFSRSRDIQRHCRAKHTIEEVQKFICPYCNSELGRKDSLQRHVSRGTCKKTLGLTA